MFTERLGFLGVKQAGPANGLVCGEPGGKAADIHPGPRRCLPPSVLATADGCRGEVTQEQTAATSTPTELKRHARHKDRGGEPWCDLRIVDSACRVWITWHSTRTYDEFQQRVSAMLDRICTSSRA